MTRHLLAFKITSKVFTPCMGVCHESWGPWCIIISSMVYDGFEHRRWFWMFFHIGNGLLSGFLTLIGCLHDNLP
jgi:hypothetical protein